MNIPLVDLKAQYAAIKDEIDGAIAAVIAKTAFIGGPFAKQVRGGVRRLLSGPSTASAWATAPTPWSWPCGGWSSSPETRSSSRL